MNRGLVISGVGHAALILWVFLGDWLFLPAEPPAVQVASVSILSSAEFDAMVSEAPAAPKDAPDQPVPPVTAEARPVAPEQTTGAQPQARPVPDQPAAAEAPDPSTDVPISDTPQPEPVPQTDAPVGTNDQPIPVPNSDLAPAPRPIDRVAAVPVDNTRDAPELADAPTPEQSDAPAPDALPVEKQPDAAPQEATTQIVTEATDTSVDAPQLAPMSSRRPQTRPKAPAPDTTQQASAAPPKPAAEPATEDAVAAAVAAAVAEQPAQDRPASDATSDTGGTGTADRGPPMTAGETDALRVAVSKCWSLGAISTEAMQTIVTVQLALSEDGRPDTGSIRMSDFTGGSETSANQMFEVARRAIIRCGKNGFPLPPEKYATWKNLELVFDPNGMRLR